MQMQMETNLTAATRQVLADEQVRIVCRPASTNTRPGAKNAQRAKGSDAQVRCRQKQRGGGVVGNTRPKGNE